ncbi:hypothetical protein [Galbibacter pacificus]|uniref:Multidrug transporter n=1 Tax=Galbibacter pacificus TaxID=2996052 RepID=A0ABT6FWE4_9FLAO|nr:hypothetical protein [Galbibacter pacificus]MDG3583979.1 hypothetical protein [Galbibacter pacificus]MDG3587584.1 hypothetical protein [Galbibacter pacificus]
MKNLKTFLSMAAIAVILASCSSDDDNSDNPIEEKDGKITSTTDPDYDPANLQGEVVGDITLAANTAYTLTGSLKVTENATLTIEAGTTITAHAESEADRTKLYITIAPGSKIMANGTATAPITITSDDKEAGAWGGLLIAGNARQNKNDGGTAVAEVGDGLTYGGDNDEDNSGVIKYMILEYTGSAINSESEFNGFTFYAVGNGTTVENIAVMSGSDDAFEFFGGTVNVKNALGVNVKDDIFDWTDGWRGTATNFYGLREDGFDLQSEDPRGIEADSNENDNAAEPRSNPTFNGLTIVNKSNSIAFTDAIKLRRGTDVTITNALVLLPGTAGAEDFIDLTDGKGPANMVSINVTSEGMTIDDVKNEQDAETLVDISNITVGAGNTGADASAFDWVGITL